MVSDRVILRLGHILEAITRAKILLAGKSHADLLDDWTVRLLLERLLEVISEASRHIPDALRTEYGAHVPWQQVAGIGNNLRHGYDEIDSGILWDVATQDLPVLDAAVRAMLDHLDTGDS